MSSELYGLVLAGGESRRMGHDKALLVRGEESQLSFIASLLDDMTEKVFVSSRSEQADDPERSQFATIVDRYEGIGPAAGILSAMDEYPDVNWLIVACDLPNIDASTLKFLLQHRSHEHPFTAFKSSYDGLPEPLCAIYASGSDHLIREFVDNGMVCPRKMLISSDTLLLEQPNPGALDNINTPDDLAASVLEAAQ